MPKQIASSEVASFANSVEVGKYKLFPSSEIPEGIPLAGEDCQAVLIAAGEIYSSDIPGLPPKMTPSGPVYLWRGYRTSKVIDPPRKVDDCLYYLSSDGSPWSIHSKVSPDHHLAILSSTDMEGLIEDWRLPSKWEGSLDEFRIAGVDLDFKLGFGSYVVDDED